MIIVDQSKLSTWLGEQRKVPVEVLPFGARSTAAALARLGRPQLREQGGAPFLTDSGNWIFDLAVEPLTAPRQLEERLHAVPGVVETGLFLGRADVVIIASEQGIRSLTPASR